MSGFVRAQRRRVFIKLALTGPSGSGKTYSALRLAFGLGRKVALLDTENGSGSLYADLGEYDVMEVGAPFLVEKYVAGICEAAEGEYDVLIIDSLSHAWAGDGGLLAQKEALDQRGGNSFSNWNTITKQHEQLKTAMLQAPLHIVATMRSKTEYLMHEGRDGRTTPRKVGMAPVQRDGIEYEFSTVFDLAMDHTSVTTKDRTGLFDGMAEVLTEKHGRRIKEWLEGGAEPLPQPAPEAAVEIPRAVFAPARAEAEAMWKEKSEAQSGPVESAGASAAVKAARSEFLYAAQTIGIAPDFIRNVRNLRDVAAVAAPDLAEKSPLAYSVEDWRALTSAILLHNARPNLPPLPGQPPRLERKAS